MCIVQKHKILHKKNRAQKESKYFTIPGLKIAFFSKSSTLDPDWGAYSTPLDPLAVSKEVASRQGRMTRKERREGIGKDGSCNLFSQIPGFSFSPALVLPFYSINYVCIMVVFLDM